MTAATRTVKLPRILLAEDSITSATIVSRYLSDKFDVRCAAGGAAAWDLLNADENIELILTDIDMPGLDGNELLSRIRASASARLKTMPVIVMTTTANDTARRTAFANGASDFVGKPPDPLELRARVRLQQHLASTIRELEASRALLCEQTSIDLLTRLKNRRAFYEIGGRRFASARRHARDLAVVMLDIDHLGALNDNYGRLARDRALVNIAQTLARHTRAGDTTARFGEKEFAVLLPNTGKAGATLLAERIRAELHNHRNDPADRSITATAGSGIASYPVDRPASLDELIEHADRRAYLAKQAGRNRVVAEG